MSSSTHRKDAINHLQQLLPRFKIPKGKEKKPALSTFHCTSTQKQYLDLIKLRVIGRLTCYIWSRDSGRLGHRHEQCSIINSLVRILYNFSNIHKTKLEQNTTNNTNKKTLKTKNKIVYSYLRRIREELAK